MAVEFDNRPFWKPRDLAEMLEVSPSQIYRLIESGELAHVKVGQRTVRVPGAAVAAMVGQPLPAPAADGGQDDPEARVRRFEERTGHSPNSFIERWKRDQIDDTPENNEYAMEALALREAGTPSHA